MRIGIALSGFPIKHFGNDILEICKSLLCQHIQYTTFIAELLASRLMQREESYYVLSSI